MMEPKEGVLDRIGQTFEMVFTKAYLPIIGLLSAWGILIYVCTFAFTFFSSLLIGTKYGDINQENFWTILGSVEFVLIVIGGLVGLLVVSMISLSISTSVIYGLQQIYKGSTLDIKYTLRFGFDRMLKIFNLYYYSFLYIAGIPSLLFIIGGIILIFGLQNGENSSQLSQLGGFIVGIGMVIGVFFLIYRGVKQTFFLYHAIENDDYSKENFKKSIQFSEGNWWRIVGNIFLISFIISLVSSMVTGILGVISFASSGGPDALMQIVQNKDILNNPKEIMNSLKGLTSSTPIGMVIDMIKIIIGSISTAITMAFTYVLYQRLVMEKTPEKKSDATITL